MPGKNAGWTNGRWVPDSYCVDVRSNQLREAIFCQNGWIFTHCVNGPCPPPPLGFTRSCCDFFDMNVKKCVNVRLDKIWRNSAKICGQNVKFTLKLWQFYPWKYFFVPILCCQKASRIIQIRNINFYTWVRPPAPLYTMCKNSSDLAEDGFPKIKYSGWVMGLKVQ